MASLMIPRNEDDGILLTDSEICKACQMTDGVGSFYGDAHRWRAVALEVSLQWRWEQIGFGQYPDVPLWLPESFTLQHVS
jgi:hypothetical protein